MSTLQGRKVGVDESNFGFSQRGYACGAGAGAWPPDLAAATAGLFAAGAWKTETETELEPEPEPETEPETETGARFLLSPLAVAPPP